MIDRRERTPLYDRYEAVIRKPRVVAYDNSHSLPLEVQQGAQDNTGVGRSTLLAPARTFACEAQLEILTEEILHSSKSDNNGQETQSRSRRKSCKTGGSQDSYLSLQRSHG